MLKTAVDILESYIKGKDQDKAEILEEIYSKESQVIFDIKSDTISFPPAISGNVNIAKVLSRDFNKKYDKVRTYYLKQSDRHPISLNILQQRWLVIMRDMESHQIRIGTGFYDWHLEETKEGVCQISQHKIIIGVMLCLSAENLSLLEELQNCIPYPWVDKRVVVKALSKHFSLKELTDYME